MAPTHYQLVFDGEVEPGHDVDTVRNTLVELFELTAEQQSRSLAGDLLVLGRGMDSATAESFRQVLTASGAVSRVVEDRLSATSDRDKVSRSVRRRVEAKRRAQVRGGAIVPDRRDGKDRRG